MGKIKLGKIYKIRASESWAHLTPEYVIPVKNRYSGFYDVYDLLKTIDRDIGLTEKEFLAIYEEVR